MVVEEEAMEDEEDASEGVEAVEEEAQLLVELGPCTSARDLGYSTGCQAYRRYMPRTLGTPPAPAHHPQGATASLSHDLPSPARFAPALLSEETAHLQAPGKETNHTGVES